MRWKPNWDETKRHLVDWWNQDGLVVGTWGAPPARNPHAQVPDPGPPEDVDASYIDPQWRVAANHHRMARSAFPADVLPVPDYDWGPGSLAIYLGSEPKFEKKTVWFLPFLEDVEQPEKHPPLRLQRDGKWWTLTERLFRRAVEVAGDKYMIGCPDLIENIDTLASIRGNEQLLMDMVERPEWVLEKMNEITAAWIEAYDLLYDIIKLEDGSSAFNAFKIWGPGKTAKLQCDASAMISPGMFERFVLPSLQAQCSHTDYSMFHLDGHQCIPHLELLLSIDDLNAIEWTPDPKVPSGGNPHWYPMYRKILEAGKSVQAIGIRRDEVLPLLDAVGGKGMYIHTVIESQEDGEKLAALIEPYR